MHIFIYVYIDLYIHILQTYVYMYIISIRKKLPPNLMVFSLFKVRSSYAKAKITALF